nr:phospholipase-like protein [Tanacetum cinerariifolium]
LVVYNTEVDTHEGNRNINIRKRKRKVPEKEGSRRKMVDRKVKGQNVGELHKEADMGVGVMKKATRKRRLVLNNNKEKSEVFDDASDGRILVMRVWLIETNDIISKMEEINNQLTVAEASKIDASWLRVHLETILNRNEAQEKKTPLMEMTTNTMFVKRAERTDLKERYDKLVVAQIQFKEAKRCVKVLDLVEKMLNSDALEFKTEKYLLDM